jgi:hypothetical protein
MIAAIIILVFSTQVFIPLWKGTKLFPGIRRRKLDAQMKEVKEEVEREELMDEITEESKKLKKNREEKKEDEGVQQQQPPVVGPRDPQKGN